MPKIGCVCVCVRVCVCVCVCDLDGKRRNWLTLGDGTDGKLVPCAKNRMAMKERLSIEMGITIFWLEKTSKLSHNRGFAQTENLVSGAKIRMVMKKRLLIMVSVAKLGWKKH